LEEFMTHKTHGALAALLLTAAVAAPAQTERAAAAAPFAIGAAVQGEVTTTTTRELRTLTSPYYPDDPAYLVRLGNQIQLLKQAPALAANPASQQTLARMERNQAVLAQHQEAMRKIQGSAATLRKEAAHVADLARHAHGAELEAKATAKRLAAVNEIVLMSQRVSRSAVEAWGPAGLQPEAVVMLGKDTEALEARALALRDGNAADGIAAPRRATQKADADELLTAIKSMRTHALVVLRSMIVLDEVGIARFELENDVAKMLETALAR
jgi:hypothetical protein